MQARLTHVIIFFLALMTLPACSRASATTEEARAGAEAALIQYFELLNTAQYTQAADLYGGDYNSLLEYNPEINPNNHSALLRSACEINGYQCLKVKEIIQTDVVSETSFDIIVTFIGKNGSMFRLAACCGGNPTFVPPTVQFTYRVNLSGKQYSILTLPPYAP